MNKTKEPETTRTKRHTVHLNFDARRFLRTLRNDANLTVDKLATRAGVSDKQVANMESEHSVRERFDERCVAAVAKALGVSSEEVQLGRRRPAGAQARFETFEAIEGFCEEIDNGLLPVIRDLTRLKPSVVDAAHRDLLVKRMRDKGTDLDEFLDMLNRQDYMRRMADTLPEPDMVFQLAADLTRATILFDGHKISVPKPTLLWDCHCDTPGTGASQDECPLHRNPKLRATLKARFDNGHIRIEHKDMVFWWRNRRALWPPSFDSFLMLRTLVEEGLCSGSVGSILDVGCGTGFLGIALGAMNPSVTKIDLSDWLLTPLLYSRLNWHLNNRSRAHVDARVHLGLFTHWLGKEIAPYDTVVCNPPYLPLLSGKESLGLEATVAGTDLLSHVIERAHALGRRVYLQYSHMAREEAHRSASKAGAQLKPVGPEREVPFRVRIAWSEQGYVDALLSQRGLIHKADHRHPYWHRLQAYEIVTDSTRTKNT